jgi:hypothetical protein
MVYLSFKNYKNMRPLLLIILLVSAAPLYSIGQGKPSVARPKLVVGIVVDQMRWDYLYRFSERYGNDGFKRMLREGFTCENTLIPYAQTVTAAGHASVYTGSVPALHGIMGNEWFDKQLNGDVYCTEDNTVKLVGVPGGEPMSPANLWTTTISDELRLATNFHSKVIGISIKDRGAILPAGHSANAAYWYDGVSGKWITSTYYMQALPSWVNQFNDKKWPDTFYQKDWSTLLPLESYVQSDADDVPYEGKLTGEKSPVFPHVLKSKVGKDYGAIRVTPYGNTFTLQFAKEAIQKEELGRDDITDLLAVSLSSPDYIGHTFGPNSIEIEDTYLRLDRDLADLFAFLDKQVGAGSYTVFLTADHAVAHVPDFLKAHKIPGSVVSVNLPRLNKLIEERFRISNALLSPANYQLHFNDTAIAAAGVERKKIVDFCIDHLERQPEVLAAFDMKNIASCTLPVEVRETFVKGYNAKRSGDVQIVLKSGYFYGFATGTTHGTFYAYDSHIPLVWMGNGIASGKLNREVYMTDIAATLAGLLHIQMPSGCIGKVIPEVIK